MKTHSIERVSQSELVDTLRRILEKHAADRVVIVGTTCTGKTTLLKELPEVSDMDELVFPLLTPEESVYVCQSPWTPEIGQTMTRLVKERVRVKPGQPVAGTVVLDCELIVQLQISDALLRERTELRGASFEDAKRMQEQIEQAITASGITVVRLFVG